MTNEPSCANCKHWRGGVICAAYPNGIPWTIMSGDVSHLEPLPDDNGLQWERKESDADGGMEGIERGSTSV